MAVGFCTLCGHQCEAVGGDVWQALRDHVCVPRPLDRTLIEETNRSGADRVKRARRALNRVEGRLR